jgi:hypothetical protein
VRHHRLAALLAASALLALAAAARADETVFDFEAAGPDQEGTYEASAGARLEAGLALLALTTGPEWWDEAYAFRKQLTITRSVPIGLPRFSVPLDGAGTELFDLALVDGSDLRLVDPLGALVTPWWVELFGRIQRQGDLRVVASDVPAGSSTWHAYFGGPGAAGHRIDVFSHASPVAFTWPGDDDACTSSGLVIMSFVDSNTVEAGSTSVTLDAGETVTLAAGSLVPETPVTATGPVFAAFDTVGDAAAPARLAGYQFVYAMPRYPERFTVVSPEADATVSITAAAGVLDTFTVPAGASASRDLDVPDLEAASFLSDAPVSIIRHGFEPTIPEVRDYMVMCPPALDLMGPTMGNVWVAALEDATTGTAYLSDGTTQAFSLDALGTVQIGVSGTQGAGPAVRILADRPVMALAYADGDGGDMVTFLPTRWLGTEHVVPFDAQYLFAAAPVPGTECTLVHGGGTVVLTADTRAPPYAKKLYWGSATAGANLTAPITLACDAPVFAAAERTMNDDEVNLWPLRFYRARTPDLGFSWGAGLETRYASPSGTVTTPLFRAPAGVKAWQGFEQRGATEVPESTALRYLLSTDGGTTWLTADGTLWVEAYGPIDALDAARVDEAIGTLPPGEGLLTVRAVLESADSVHTPALDEIGVVYEPPGPLAAFTFDPVPAVVTAGVAVTVTITAVDADGTRVRGFAESVLLFTEPPDVTLSPTTSPAFTAGQASFELRFHGEGTVDLVALSGEASGRTGPITVVEGGGEPARLEKVGGDEQFGPVGGTLPEPLEVRVLDADSIPVAGVTVQFTATAGGGALEPAEAFTGADGVASADWTLGPEPGANRAQADAGGIEGSPAAFVARGDPDDGGGSASTTGCGCILVY